MDKNVFLLFTDECGTYTAERSKRSLSAHPFYVRANLIIALDDYLTLEEEMNRAKNEIGIPIQTEIKWSHFGKALKGRKNLVPGELGAKELFRYFDRILSCLEKLATSELYFTLTDNKAVGRVSKENLIKMHLQNAFQRAEYDAAIKNGYVFVMADDMGSENKSLKKAMYSLATTGDNYTDYSHINRGLFIEYSDQCCGLQVADICVGAFTSSLKYISADESEQHKFSTGYHLLTNRMYKSIRFSKNGYPDVYGYGIKEVPAKTGDVTAKRIAEIVGEKLHDDICGACF